MKDQQQIQVADRIFLVLETLADSTDGLGVSELSRMTALHKTTVHRVLSSLVKLGYVQHKPGGDKYRLSLKMFSVGSRVLEDIDLRKVAHPFLQELANKTEQIVHLAMFDMDTAVYIDKIEGSNRMVRIFSRLGRRIPLHCTGLGKVLLSGKDDEFVQRAISKQGLAKYTEKTITTIDGLRAELDKIRRQGYAADDAEHEEGLACVAAPIFDMNKNVAAAVSISYFSQFVDDLTRERYINDIRSTCEAISKSCFGYNI